MSLKPAPSLRELQEWMRWAITDPRGVNEALSNPRPSGKTERYQAPSPDIREAIVAPGGGRAERLSIYAEAYFSRILESLAADFPATHRELGEERFTILIAEYLKVHPSSYRNIGEVGRQLAAFVRGPFGADTAAWQLPWLTDLVALEWLLIECFYSLESPPFDLATVAHAADDDWERAKIVFADGARLISSRWPIETIRSHDGGSESRFESRAGSGSKWPEQLTELLIYRKSGHAYVAPLERSESACLSALMSGARLSAAIDAALSASDAESVLESKVSEWFAKWTSLGLISSIEL